MARHLLLLTFVLVLSGCAAFGSGPAPVYGCWCGKNQPAPGEDPTPVDAWDAACKRHDLCYQRRGRDHPRCDIAFVQRLEAIALRQGYVPGQMQAAHSYFASRLYGMTYVQGWFTAHDIGTFIDSGDESLCDY